MGHAQAAADPSGSPRGYRGRVGDGFGNGDETSSWQDGVLRSPTEKLRSPQSWAASTSQVLTRETQALSLSKEMPRGCTRLCQEPWGHTGSGRSNAWRGGQGQTDRQTDRHLPRLISNHFINAVCTLSVADREPSLEKMPSKGRLITLQAEGCFLDAMTLYIQAYISIYILHKLIF